MYLLDVHNYVHMYMYICTWMYTIMYICTCTYVHGHMYMYLLDVHNYVYFAPTWMRTYIYMWYLFLLIFLFFPLFFLIIISSIKQATDKERHVYTCTYVYNLYIDYSVYHYTMLLSHIFQTLFPSLSLSPSLSQTITSTSRFRSFLYVW